MERDPNRAMLLFNERECRLVVDLPPKAPETEAAVFLHAVRDRVAALRNEALATSASPIAAHKGMSRELHESAVYLQITAEQLEHVVNEQAIAQGFAEFLSRND